MGRVAAAFLKQSLMDVPDALGMVEMPTLEKPLEQNALNLSGICCSKFQSEAWQSSSRG